MAEYLVKIPGRDYCWRARIEHGRIEALQRAENESTPLWLTRGLVDIQVNGYNGVLLTKDGVTDDELASCEQALADQGTVKWCPTVTTNDPEVIRSSLGAIKRAVDNGSLTRVQCIHTEANFLSAEEGYRGAHMPRYMSDPTLEEFEAWQEAAGGLIGYVSLAPERKGAIDFTAELAGRGILVALAHHNGSWEQIAAATDAGARLSTHLFNGCRGEVNRHNNVIYAQLAEDRLWASFIPDGQHIPYHVLKTGIRAKGIERSVFTSDVTYLGGYPEGEYTKAERTVEIRDGAVWIKDSPYLSGAWSTMSQGVERATAAGAVTPDAALRMASNNPARLMGIEDGLEVAAGKPGPFVMFRESEGALKLDKIIS
jgi:N-acetylglucosamine-6-phosphate deacetylase